MLASYSWHRRLYRYDYMYILWYNIHCISMKHESATITTYKVIGALLVSVAGLYVAYQLRTIILWVIIGGFFAVIINPAVSRLAKRMPKQKRGLALAIVLAILTIGLVGFASLIITPLLRQTTLLAQQWPTIVDNVNQAIANSTGVIADFLNQHGLTTYLGSQKGLISANISALLLGSMSKLVGIMSSIIAGFTIFMITIYLSLNGPQYYRTLLKRVPANTKADVAQLSSLMYRTFTGYVNGNLITSFVAGITAGLLSTALGLPYAAVLGVIVAITDLIPLIGAQLGALIVTVVAYFVSPQTALIMLVFFIVFQAFENYVLSPMVMSRTVNVSPILVFLFVLCGATLGGFVGALIAIPTGACLTILGDYLLSGTVWDKD